MVGLVKQCLYKTTVRANLSQKEFEEIALHIEVTLSNRLLMYVEDDIEMPVLTPNRLLYGQPLLLPEEDLDDDVPEIKRRQRYINKCKDAAKTRWTKEYLKALRERNNMLHQTKVTQISLGDIVLIKGDEKNRGKWNIEMVYNILVNLWELEILPRPLIEYHLRKLFIVHECDLICIKCVIGTVFIQLELCFHRLRTYCRI